MASMRTMFVRQNDIVYWQILEGVCRMLLIVNSWNIIEVSYEKMLGFIIYRLLLKLIT